MEIIYSLAALGAVVLIAVAVIVVQQLGSYILGLFPQYREHTERAAYERGVNYAERLIAGKCDKDVRKYHDCSDNYHVSDRERISYAENKLGEAKHFGHYGSFDKGVEASLSDYLNKRNAKDSVAGVSSMVDSPKAE